MKNKRDLILESVAGMNVLDVGCVGQDAAFDSESWLHGLIKLKCKKLIGVDIDKNKITMLNGKGYDVLHIDELKNLDEKFDIIVIADVIEHVDNAGDFLDFYSKFLTPAGKLIVCTPNATNVRFFLQVLFYGKSVPNPEHTSIYDKYTLQEIGRRVGLRINKFEYTAETSKATNFQRKFIMGISRIFSGLRKSFSPNLYVEFLK